jgi:predicted permease
MRRFLLRLLHAVRPNRADADVAREIASHVAMLEDDFLRRGLSEEEARAAAHRALGSTALTADWHRDARSFVWLDDLRRDFGYAARLLRRQPIFALTAAISLAIGIGANTTMFTVANALLLRDPTGVAEPARLVDIGRTVRRGRAFNPASYPDYLDVRRRATTLDGVYATPLFPAAMSLRIANSVGPERVFATPVTLNYFSVLGVVPVAGRLFDGRDSEQSGASPIAVLSHRFWTSRFGGNPAIIGETVRINEQPFTIVGITPDGFQGTGVRASDVWIPITMTATSTGTSVLTNRAAAAVLLGARLKPGVLLAAAAAEINAIGRALEREYPSEDGGKGLLLLPLSPVPGNAGPIAVFLALLMGIVALVLVIACANLAGVLLARATARRHEIAIRLAIGAGRSRLIRQLLTETLLLFALGGAFGVVLARVLMSVLVVMLPALPFPVDLNLTVDTRVLAFTTGLSLVAALACGLVPALQAANADAASALKDVQGAATGSRLRHAFLVAQVAGSIVLVVVAALFVRALQHVAAGSPGFDPRGVELATVDLSVAGYTDTTGPMFARQLIDRVRQLPGVQDATIAAVLPGGFERISLGGLDVPGVSPPAGQRLFSADWNIVEPAYFSTLRMPIITGRDFNAGDRAGGSFVAILGEGAARRFWPGQDPIGKYVVQMVFGPPSTVARSMKRLVVVGVARDPTYGTLVDNTTGINIYVPLQQQYHTSMTTIVVRSTHGQTVLNELRGLLASVNPNLPIVMTQTAEEYTSVGLLPQRIGASVAGSLGLVGLLLAAIGIYGVTAYAVACRTREFGIRIALGATRRDIITIVLRYGLGLTASGCVVGLLLAMGAGRLVVSLLFGVGSADPVAFTTAALLCAAVGLLACYVPARRATRIDAIETLRCE